MDNFKVKKISPAGELILLSSRNTIDSASKRKIKELLGENLDWNFIKDLAIRNKIIHLLCNTLKNNFQSEIDEEVYTQISDEVSVHVSSNKDALNLLFDVNQLLSSEDIPVIIFKGLVFSYLVYDSSTYRCQGDIDLLVRPEDFLKARDILIRNGFISTYFGHAEVSTVQAQLGRTDKRASVDLHYGLTPQYQQTNMNEAMNGSKFDRHLSNTHDKSKTRWFCYLETAPVWERAIEIKLEDETIKTLSPEDTLLVAVIHGLKENWRTLSRISDIAAIITKYKNLNWALIQEAVANLNYRKKFFLTLRLAREIYDINLPDEILRCTYLHGSEYLAKLIIYRFTIKNYLADFEESRRIAAAMTMDNPVDFFRYLIYVYNTPNGPFNEQITKNNFPGFMLILTRHYINSIYLRLTGK